MKERPRKDAENVMKFYQEIRVKDRERIRVKGDLSVKERDISREKRSWLLLMLFLSLFLHAC